MATIQITEPPLSAEEVRAEILTVIDGTATTENGELSDAVARTIAAWWQSSGTVGSLLASLACGHAVDRDALYEDIAASGRTAMPMWPRELELMATWALNHG